MFGQNQIVGKKAFKDAPKDSLLVTSIFFTLQGEGPFMGFPAVFVRLAKCNLACSFCDTYFDTGTWMDYAEIDNTINKCVIDYFKDQNREVPNWAASIEGSGTYHIEHPGVILVITGGEPSIQDNLEGFLIAQANQWNAMQIESNGLMQFSRNVVAMTHLVVSPKCVEIDGKADHYSSISMGVLQDADYLKFVVSADPNSPYHTLPDYAFKWSRDCSGEDVFVSPMNVYAKQPEMPIFGGGVDAMAERSLKERISFWTPGLLDLKANQANHKHAARIAMDNGFRLNLQMHLYASLP